MTFMREEHHISGRNWLERDVQIFFILTLVQLTKKILIFFETFRNKHKIFFTQLLIIKLCIGHQSLKTHQQSVKNAEHNLSVCDLILLVLFLDIYSSFSSTQFN